MKTIYITLALVSLTQTYCHGQDLSNSKIDGYKGIWFELTQKYEYGDKYSGSLGTYTAKHNPLAIYAKSVDKTFFVFGGTLTENDRYLVCMIGEYNHKTGLVSKPTVVYDKKGVNDPHDNPSILIDDKGFIWVFISGRGRSRPGFKYKSKAPYSIEEFVQITEEEMTYPQPKITDFGMFHFFTKYTGVRELYFETSKDGTTWTEDKKLASIPEQKGDDKSGHYQISGAFNRKVVGTFLNRHPNGVVDKRTDLYYVESDDFGTTWQTVDGTKVDLPLTDRLSPARVVDYSSQKKNIYLKDMGYDTEGNPTCLYIRSNGHEPGPISGAYEWCTTSWNGLKWETNVVTSSDHNYDMGSIFISEDSWTIVGPTEVGPQAWGVGGELAIWESKDKGLHWEKIKTITENSKYSHSYVRRPVDYKAPFCFFWADGHSHTFSPCRLYFGDFEGNVWQLPYEMKSDFEKPLKIN